MNGTLRDLAIQAGLPRAGFDANGPVIQNSKEIERLAYAIISECAILVEGYYNERTQQYAGPTIKEYFGIKEQ
jgi:hypothetical protein